MERTGTDGGAWRAHAPATDRPGGHQVAPARPSVPPAAGSLGLATVLQHSAGNAATARLLARRAAVFRSGRGAATAPPRLELVDAGPVPSAAHSEHDDLAAAHAHAQPTPASTTSATIATPTAADEDAAAPTGSSDIASPVPVQCSAATAGAPPADLSTTPAGSALALVRVNTFAQAGSTRRLGASVIQRDGEDSSGGPAAPAPNPDAKTPEQTADDVLADFTQGKFRDIDWSAVTDTSKKLRLLEKATDPSLVWVGPRDEAAIEQCWASMGSAFEAAVRESTIVWNRSLDRGADPENIPQTRGLLAAFKGDISAAANQNLDANEDRIVDEFLSFGIQPPWDIVRASQPKRGRLANTSPAGGLGAWELLESQSRAARVAAHLDSEQKRLAASWVGLGQNYDSSRPNPDRELQLGNGQTMWTVVDAQLREVSLLLATVLNTWPVLYGAWTTGSLEVIAQREFDSTDPLDPKTAEQQEAGLADVRTNLSRSLEAIHRLRDDPLNPLDMLPVERGLFTGAIKPVSGRVPNRDVMLGIMSDARADRNFENAVIDRALDVVIAASLIAATVATGGGVAAGMAITAAGAGANVLKAGVKAGFADTRAVNLQDAQTAAVSQSGVIVDRSTVSIAEIEAHNARVDVVVAAVQGLQDLGTAAFSPHIPEGEVARIKTATKGASVDGPKATGALGELRTAAGGMAALEDASPKKSWDIAPEYRPQLVSEPANLRLQSEGVPRAGAMENPRLPKNEMRFSPETWTFEIHPEFLAGAETTVKRFNEMVELLYHEARHAWQTFQVARWRLMKIRQGVALTEDYRFQIRPEVEAAARKVPMMPGDPLEADVASWHGSQWGSKGKARAAIYEEKDLFGKELEAQTAKVERLPENAPDATRKIENEHLRGLRASYDDADKAYRALPEEVDAYRAAGERGAWAKAGLEARYRLRVESAQAHVKSANIRVANAARELNLYRSRGITGEALAQADERYRSAIFDAETVEQSLNAARASH